jgi:hypothetical protein
LRPGQSIVEHKTATLPANVKPRQGDILFSFDLTGSMEGELNNVKANSQNIMTAVRSEIPDTNFGVVSHMDYMGTFTSCGYSDMYGGSTGSPPIFDYPYNLNRSLTDNTGLVATSIQALVLGYGGDFPECYTRVFYESYADPNIGWRPGAKKILLAWLDAMPHDCDFAEILLPNLNKSLGKDPGRDAKVDTSDNLEILLVLQEMAAQNITLIVVYSFPDDPTHLSEYGGFPLWQAYAAVTGGSAFKINPNGTIPDGTQIDQFVAGLIQEAIGHINALTLKVSDPGYEDWLVSVAPASYTDIVLNEAKVFEFDIQLKVPEGTADGEYHFTVDLVGDGVVYSQQEVSITVSSEVAVPFDIKPGSCPNPLNVGSKGVTPAAVAGTAALAASSIDPASIRLEGVPALRWGYEDVTVPFEPYTGKPLVENACSLLGPDGFPDLTLKFDTEALAAALVGVNDGQVLALHLVGALSDGTPIVGEDVVRIIQKK